MDQFPSNAKGPTEPPPEAKPKRVERVTSGTAVRKKQSLSSRFTHTFIGGDANTAWSYVVSNVIIPEARDMLVNVGHTIIEQIVYGKSRPRRGMAPPATGPLGAIAYNRMHPGANQSPASAPSQSLSREAKARHRFDQIVIESRADAEEVLTRMYDLMSQYSEATIADLYELVGIQSSHVDHTWGWTQLRGAKVERMRGGGYILALPEPVHLK
jgi:hypothetical protein